MMSTNGRKQSRKSSTAPRSTGNGTNTATDIPAALSTLSRTSVYKRLPPSVRSRLDKAILLRSTRATTLTAIDRRFGLADRYGITPTSLKSYARRLEQLIRPEIASQLMAAVLGCLPKTYRQQLIAGSQVLLLSRIIKTLGTDGESALPIGDLARLATILSSVAVRSTTGHAAGSNRRKREKHPQDGPRGNASFAEPAQLAEAVRMLYGLSWPPAETPCEKTGKS